MPAHRALWAFLPVLGAYLAHAPVLRFDLLPALKRPLDGGATLRGRRLLGDNKTWRGALAMFTGVLAATVLLSRVPAYWGQLPDELRAAGPMTFGVLLALGVVLGELPNSFLKRRLDIASASTRSVGRSAPGENGSDGLDRGRAFEAWQRRRGLLYSACSAASRGSTMTMRAMWLCLSLIVSDRAFAADAPLSASQQLARDVYRELIEINTVTTTGDTARAADAMAARLRSAGFAEADVQVFHPAPRKGNLVARLRGTGARKPILLVAHLDVVDAKRSDWTTDPFTLVEKDGWFYARGSGDDKAMAAAWVTALMRYKREGFVPTRDIVLVLETDEEGLDRDVVGMRWLLEKHRDLLDAELALNEGAGVAYAGGKPIYVGLQTSEKVSTRFLLEVKNKGGHSSLPSRDNAIYHLADALGRLSRFGFPVNLNETTRAWFERTAVREEPAVAADIRAVLGPTPDADAVERLSRNPVYNAMLRTTCVATLLEAGHASNALPQTARATLSCRILPGEPVDEVQRTLVRVVADEQVSVTTSGGTPSPPSPLEPSLVRTIERVASEFWPGVPVVPTMLAGATDGLYLRNAGIPTYGHSGMRGDLEENRAHGKDERLSVEAFYKGSEYLYRLVKALASGRPGS
jgi:acetylornithine deacetylase/succinyl-diaminopimelate desuccinylase-like protein